MSLPWHRCTWKPPQRADTLPYLTNYPAYFQVSDCHHLQRLSSVKSAAEGSAAQPLCCAEASLKWEQEDKHQGLEMWCLLSSHSDWGQGQIQCWLQRLSYELAARDPNWKKLWTVKGKGVLCSPQFFFSITFWQSCWTLV